MPRISRQKQHLINARASKFAKSNPDQYLSDAMADLILSRGDHSDSEDDITMDNSEISDVSDDEGDFNEALEGLLRLRASSEAIAIQLQWRPVTEPARRCVYTGNSIRTQQLRRQKQREAAVGSRSILDYFATAQTSLAALPLERD